MSVGYTERVSKKLTAAGKGGRLLFGKTHEYDYTNTCWQYQNSAKVVWKRYI